MGLAFQIQDDILDVTSTSEELGKPVLSDEKNQKTTYVTLVGLDQAKADVAEISARAVSAVKGTPGRESVPGEPGHHAGRTEKIGEVTGVAKTMILEHIEGP